MKKIGYLLASAGTFALPLFASAQLISASGDGGGIENMIRNLIDIINTVLVPGVIALAFLVFIWGVFTFFILGGGNEEKREQGKSLMIYSILGFVLIAALWGIVALIVNSIGLGGGTITVPDTITIT